MIELRLDLQKAEKAPHHDYFLRMLRTLNDLLSTIQLCDAVDESTSLSEDIKLPLKLYLMRLQHSHLVEACKAFIYMIKPKPEATTPEYDWICTHTELKEQFEHLRRLLDIPIYQRLMKFRDTFGFHYNHKDESLPTKEAIGILVKLWSRFKEQEPSNLNLLRRSDNTDESRYFIADHMIWLAFLKSLGLSPNNKEADSIIKHFRGEILGTFMSFAEAAILAWVIDNGLSTKQ
ncbi:MAG: hypothetical protein K2Y22_03585 [Candidatus Obscuribacterales bacterium]|nr:hypothetical protein [Candidatus Obscuribacterales bacterium]